MYDTATGQLVREMRRGVDQADIYSITFSQYDRWLLCGSNKGTIHVYSLTATQKAPEQRSSDDDYVTVPQQLDSSNKTSALAFMKNVLPKYFSSEWSHSKCIVETDQSFICCMRGDAIVAVCCDGSFHQFKFNPLATATGESQTNECPREFYHKFMSGE